MNVRRLVWMSLFATLNWPAAAQVAAPPLPAGDKDPVLRLEGRGPLSSVQAVAFGPGGTTLYDAGWDKVVRVWRRGGPNDEFKLDPRATLRVPIGPGDSGVLMALAVSPDGAWLAAAGNALSPENAGFRQSGLIVPRASLNLEDQGVIYLFDLRVNPRVCHQLRGHQGSVKALMFASLPNGRAPMLVSAGGEPDPKTPGGTRLKLRAWDIATQKELAQADGGEDMGGLYPRLAAWSTAADQDRVRVAAATTSTSSLLWEVGSGPPTRLPDPHPPGRSTTLSFLPERRKLLTAHFGISSVERQWSGFLDISDETALAAPPRAAALSWGPERTGPSDVKALPIALAIVSSKRGGEKDLAAVVLRSTTGTPRPELEYRLQLIDITDASFGAVRARTTLWTGPIVQAIAAATPEGDSLAIAGNPANEVLVYSVAKLLEKKPAVQTLRSVGYPVSSASFVLKGGTDWGLRLGSTREASPDDVVFDVTNRRVSHSVEGWMSYEPNQDGWQQPPPQPADKDRPWQRLWTYKDRVPFPKIQIVPDNESTDPNKIIVTTHAWLPTIKVPRTGIEVPIAAVATIEPGVGPKLVLYNVSTGEPFRQLSGHTDVITGLSFSRDGRFLVSTSNDRTACIWALTDLDRIVQQKGALPGLVLSKGGGQYVVKKTGRAGPGEGHGHLLRAGEIVEGYVDGQGVPHPLGSALEIHFVAEKAKPGEAVTLRLSQGQEQGGHRDVALPLRQAIDERQPLLTLFLLARGPKEKPIDWLAWNPFGPYDTSGPGVASLFGWHFNVPGPTKQPVEFALATSYATLRREGLARDVIKAGRLPPPPVPAPINPPDVQMFLEPDGEARGDAVIVRQPPARLDLVLDDGVSAEQIESVSWRFDQTPFRPMQANDGSWTADLTGLTFDRETHDLTVEVRAVEPAGRSFQKHQKVRYVPWPPILRQRPPEGGGARAIANGFEVDGLQFPFTADIELAKDQKARVRLVCRQGNEIVSQREYGPNLKAAPPINELLELKPGDNTIELEAVNQDAGADTTADETGRFGPITVRCILGPVGPPSIQLDSLSLSPDQPGGTPAIVKVPAEGPCKVEKTNRVLVLGRITCKDKLQTAEWSIGDAEWKPLTGFTSNQVASFAINEPMELSPGWQQVHFRARAVNRQAPAETRIEPLTIEYRPALPDLRWLASQPPGPIIKYGIEGNEREPVKLAARIEGSPEHVGRADLFVNDEHAGELFIDRANGSVTGSVSLSRGKNKIEIQLSNAWRSPRRFNRSPPLFEYRRLPLVEDWKATVPPDRSFAGISARVKSVTPLSGAEITVALAANPPQTYPARFARSAPNVWDIVREVPLSQGKNEITLRTWNEDGAAPEKRAVLNYEKPVEPKPELFVETEKANVKAPAFPIEFEVRSRSPLASLTLVREISSTETKLVKTFPIANLERGHDGVFAFKTKSLCDLDPGGNSFKIVAVNAGGQASIDLTYTYTPPPVRVVIDDVRSRASNQAFKPRARADGPPSISETLPDSEVVVRGKLIWSEDAEKEQLKRGDLRVQVSVNGFPQVRVAPDGPVGGQRAFQAELLLGQLKDNEITFKLDGAALDVSGAQTLLVSCREVHRNWGLHLLIIGIDTTNWTELRDRAIASLKGNWSDDQKQTFTTPAFPIAKLYNEYCDDMHVGWMNRKLSDIVRTVRLSERPSNEVVMLYYQGTIVVRNNEPSLRLRKRPTDWDDDFIALRQIRKLLESGRGAKLFLLDDTHGSDEPAPPLEQSAKLIDDWPFGELRFTRHQPATADATLGATFGEAAQKTETLKDASAELDRKSVSLRDRYPSLRYSHDFAPHFDGLVISRP